MFYEDKVSSKKALIVVLKKTSKYQVICLTLVFPHCSTIALTRQRPTYLQPAILSEHVLLYTIYRFK